jgi:hypothetical protein
MPLDDDFVVQRLQRLAPFESAEQARCVFEAALGALYVVLSDEEAADLERDLGSAWSRAKRRSERAEPATLHAFYRRVGLYAGFRYGIAEELAQVCCRVLALGLPEASVRRLQTELPDLAPLFDAASVESVPDRPYRLHDEPLSDHTIAGGRPGGSRPIADARPIAGPDAEKGDAQLAHRHAVARATEPHADTKLSSARGLTQEREHRSLATAQPPRDEPEQ